MIREYVDSSSTYEIVSVFREDQPEDTYEWGWQSALAVTSSIITVPKLTIPSQPRIINKASGPYGQLTKELSNFLVQDRHNNNSDKKYIDNVNSAKRLAKSWAARNPEKLRNAYGNIKKDPSYDLWMEGYRTHSWTEHATRLDGLFDPEFVPQISKVLDIETNKISNLWEFSRHPKNLDYLVKRGGDELQLMEDAHIISGLIRGRYYDHMAKSSGNQILQHPFRRNLVLDKSQGKEDMAFCTTNVEKYLSNIILAGAYAEKTQKKRITCYTENVYRARMAVINGDVDLGLVESDDAALERAIESAKVSNIRVHPRWIERALDACHLMGITSIGFILSPWESATFGIIDYSISKRINIDQMIPQRIYGRKKRLHDLALSMPGRIEIDKKR
jgi:hypothetical protein